MGVTLKLINLQMVNLEILYVESQGKERRYWVLDARGEYSLNTRRDDLWRLRMKTGELAAEISVGAESEQVVQVPPCVPAVQKEEVIAARAYDVEPTNAHLLTECNPWKHLSTSDPSPGMHVVCVLPPSNEAMLARLEIFADGWRSGSTREEMVESDESIWIPNTANMTDVALLVMQRLEVPRRGPQHNQPAIYSVTGDRLFSTDELLAESCVFVFEGGLWMWPPVEVGHRRELSINDGVATRDISMVSMSLFPRVFRADNVLTEEEVRAMRFPSHGFLLSSLTSSPSHTQSLALRPPEV